MTSKSKMGNFLFPGIEGEKLLMAILTDFDVGFGTGKKVDRRRRAISATAES